ncbi:TIGR03619 family F420-dependent LLM class oxidoreductase [Planotetraspora sp. A-T 1434]|uniref:TIGR03619 family F420-dependent LLM class oxidoreductase n=1 Tax=Planotetraspora sp. A-T 1434 TaxID=2979219 RepID=UPI0021BE6B53|nr:TIGR03619 family F420-dependent LLM class oxidoreductase [Planotetraspora sp. A-T 1434]MCT9933128.1 TIGR03619 family F420-dependent LLM class oxidoreductase [Planotetraspora sp. A-T 1434]
MRFGVNLGLLHPAVWTDVAVAADELGYESVWLPEHLVLTTDMADSGYPGAADGRPPVPPETPLFDAPVFLASIAARTRHVLLGTYVYLFGLRHPLVAARAFGTLDWVSGGRAVVGVGAGWMAAEWRALELDFATRGARLDEAIEVAKRLWTEPVVGHRGRFYSFDKVVFEPKPISRPHPPLLAGGESAAALRRAVRLCDGWISMPHTLESARPQIERLRRMLDEAGRDPGPFQLTVSAFEAPPEQVAAFEELGVHRLIVRPARRSRQAVEQLAAFAGRYGVSPAPGQ